MIEESSFKDYFILALSFLSSFKMFSSKYVWKVQKSLTVQGLSVIFKINVKYVVWWFIFYISIPSKLFVFYFFILWFKSIALSE